MLVDIEYTDTFCGEANYSWARREQVQVEPDIPDAKLKRLAKKTMGLTGVRGVWEDYGDDTLKFTPRGSCTVMFVIFNFYGDV